MKSLDNSDAEFVDDSFVVIYDRDSNMFLIKEKENGPTDGKSMEEFCQDKLPYIYESQTHSFADVLYNVCENSFAVWNAHTTNVDALIEICSIRYYARAVMYLRRNLPRESRLKDLIEYSEQSFKFHPKQDAVSNLAEELSTSMRVNNILSTPAIMLVCAVNYVLLFPIAKHTMQYQKNISAKPWLARKHRQMYTQLKDILINAKENWERSLDRRILEHSEHFEFVFILFEMGNHLNSKRIKRHPAPSYPGDMLFYSRKIQQGVHKRICDRLVLSEQCSDVPIQIL